MHLLHWNHWALLIHLRARLVITSCFFMPFALLRWCSCTWFQGTSPDLFNSSIVSARPSIWWHKKTPAQIVASCIAHIRFQFWMYSDACLSGRWEIPRPSTRIWICCWSPQWQSLKPVWRRWRSLPALPISWPLSGLRNRFPEYHWVFAVNFLHLH